MYVHKEDIYRIPHKLVRLVFFLNMADDVVLLSNTIAGLQQQFNAKRLHLVVNFEKSQVVIFRNGGCIAVYVCFTLYRYGFGFVWENQGVCNTKRFLCEFRQRLIDCCFQDWYSAMASKDRLAFYSTF